jgi:hypothetical protein
VTISFLATRTYSFISRADEGGSKLRRKDQKNMQTEIGKAI